MLTCLLVWLSSRVLCRVQSPAVLDATLIGCGMGPDLRLLRSGLWCHASLFPEFVWCVISCTCLTP